MSLHSNSITTYIDEYSVSARVRQLRSEHRRVFPDPITIVIVEGEIVDPLIYQGLFNNSRCQIVSAHGKKNALKAMSILGKDNFQGVIALVDDDFDTVNGSKIESKNIFSTDTHDIENLIIISPALEKYLLHLLPQDKKHYQAIFAKDVRKSIVDLTKPIGYIRWYFNCQDTQVDFSNINFENFIDKKNRKINIKIAVREVLSKNKDALVKEEDLFAHVQEKVESDKNVWWLICQGHDLIRILSMIIPVMLGVYAPRDRKEQQKYFDSLVLMIGRENNIVKHLAMCYEKSEFEKTAMFYRIIDWEKENTPYVVMRQ